MVEKNRSLFDVTLSHIEDLEEQLQKRKNDLKCLKREQEIYLSEREKEIHLIERKIDEYNKRAESRKLYLSKEIDNLDRKVKELLSTTREQNCFDIESRLSPNEEEKYFTSHTQGL